MKNKAKKIVSAILAFALCFAMLLPATSGITLVAQASEYVGDWGMGHFIEASEFEDFEGDLVLHIRYSVEVNEENPWPQFALINDPLGDADWVAFEKEDYKFLEYDINEWNYITVPVEGAGVTVILKEAAAKKLTSGEGLVIQVNNGFIVENVEMWSAPVASRTVIIDSEYPEAEVSGIVSAAVLAMLPEGPIAVTLDYKATGNNEYPWFKTITADWTELTPKGNVSVTNGEGTITFVLEEADVAAAMAEGGLMFQYGDVYFTQAVFTAAEEEDYYAGDWNAAYTFTAAELAKLDSTKDVLLTMEYTTLDGEGYEYPCIQITNMKTWTHLITKDFADDTKTNDWDCLDIYKGNTTKKMTISAATMEELVESGGDLAIRGNGVIVKSATLKAVEKTGITLDSAYPEADENGDVLSAVIPAEAFEAFDGEVAVALKYKTTGNLEYPWYNVFTCGWTKIYPSGNTNLSNEEGTIKLVLSESDVATVIAEGGLMFQLGGVYFTRAELTEATPDDYYVGDYNIAHSFTVDSISSMTGDITLTMEYTTVSYGYDWPFIQLTDLSDWTNLGTDAFADGTVANEYACIGVDVAKNEMTIVIKEEVMKAIAAANGGFAVRVYGVMVQKASLRGEETDWSEYFNWTVNENTIVIDGVTESGLTATELVIPNAIDDLPVVEIAPGVFKDCDNLESISFEAENDYYVIENGVIYSKDRKVLHSVTAAYSNRNFDTPWEVEEVEEWAFANRDLPVLEVFKVKKIGANAFNGCTVTSMFLSRFVEEIDEGAFRNMEYLDMSVIELIGFSIETTNEQFIINNGMIMSKDGSRILMQIYKQDTTTEVKVPGSVTEIDAYAFEECPNLEVIRIPASVTYIGEDAFVNCDNLTIITPEDSYAAEYAEEQGFKLIEIDTTADVEGVELNEENFPDKVFRNAVSDSFDVDWNGVLSEDEIANAKVFTKITAGIESLKGVEYLTELEELTVYMNKMWTLDLSANTKLQKAEISMQETKTGEIKGTIGESATVILTEFLLNPFSENKLLGYEDEKGNGTLYIRTSLPNDLYGEGNDVIWSSRRESCGMGTDMSLVDENGYRYFQVDITDTTTYVYGAIILDGEIKPEDIMPELSELSDAYFAELVVIDEYDEYGNPVLSAATAIDGAKYSLKDMTAKVDHTVTNYYTIDLAQVVGAENAKNITSVENGVLDGSVATLIPVDFMVHEIRPDLSISYWYRTAEYGPFMGVKFTFEGLVSLDDCTEVPDGFADEFDSVDDLKDHIHKDMHKHDNKHHKHQHMFDAKLWSVNDNCEWFNIAPEDFPAEGVEVFMPYPEGTGKDTDFKIAHVFEHACNGFEKGHIEYPEIKKEEHGIRFRVMGLSPIMLAYGEETAAEPETAEDFVSRLYEVVLGREADEASLAAWTGYLESGEYTGAEVAQGFIMSKEFLNTPMTNEEFVKILYSAFFGRTAAENEVAAWADYLNQGYRKSFVFSGFANSVEFGNLCEGYGVEAGSVPVTVSEQQPGLSEEEYNTWLFVERMYTEVLKRTPDMTGIKGWVDLLKAGTWTGAQVAEGFILSEEFLAKEMTNEEYVRIMYSAFFGRTADPDGLAGWVNALETGYSKEFVFAGFTNSNEFGVLCDSYGIIQGSVPMPEA